MRVFVDSSAWIAFFNKNDDFHSPAVKFFKKKPNLVSSNLVLHETVAHLQNRVSRRAAEAAAGFILDPLLVELICVLRKEEKEAFEKYKRGQKKISFVDWTNLVLMKKNKLKKIFAFDQHFAKMGLEVEPSF